MSARSIILFILALIAAAAAGLMLATRDLAKLDNTQSLANATTNTQAACSEISRKYLVAEQAQTFSSEKRLPFQSALLEIVLDHYEGTEGGFWNQEFTSYSFPTYDGNGHKTDVPSAEKSEIENVIRRSLYERKLTSVQRAGQREGIVITACPVSNSSALWMMERVSLTASGTVRSVREQLWIGFAFLAATALAGASALAYSTRKTQEQLAALKEKASRNDRVRTVGEMASGLAHDLREPLATLRLKLENVAAQPETRAKAAMPLALDQVDRVDRLIEMMLAMTRPFQLKLENVELTQWAQTNFETIRTRARAKKISLNETVSGHAQIDPFQLARAIGNLLDNAVAHTPSDGTIALSISVTDQLKIDIRDSGPGLSPTMEAKLFSETRSERSGGTGLGLILAKDIIESHKGQIRYRNDNGAHFTVEIPK